MALDTRAPGSIIPGMATFQTANGLPGESPYVIASIAFGSPALRHIARERIIDGAAYRYAGEGELDVIATMCGRVFPGAAFTAVTDVQMCAYCYSAMAPTRVNRERQPGTHVRGASGAMIRARDVRRQQAYRAKREQSN